MNVSTILSTISMLLSVVLLCMLLYIRISDSKFKKQCIKQDKTNTNAYENKALEERVELLEFQRDLKNERFIIDIISPCSVLVRFMAKDNTKIIKRVLSVDSSTKLLDTKINKNYIELYELGIGHSFPFANLVAVYKFDETIEDFLPLIELQLYADVYLKKENDNE